MVHGKLFRGGGLVLAWLLVITNSHSQTVGVLREVWEGIGGVAVADLTGSPNYPDHPTSTNFVTDLFEAPTDVLESYGQRMHGYVIPPLTGNYTFWIASDDGGTPRTHLGEDVGSGHRQIEGQLGGDIPIGQPTHAIGAEQPAHGSLSACCIAVPCGPS